MLISIIFSAALYQTSSRELTNNARRQITRFQELPLAEYEISPLTIADFSEGLEQSRAHLRASLIVYNLIILVAGGVASYWFARRTLRPIEKALDMQGRFTADASHELRTPLTAMKSEIEVALRAKDLSPKEMRELLASNLEEIDKLEALSSSLLRLARYGEGYAAMDLRKVALKPLLEKTAASYRKIAKKRHITLHTDLKDITIEADPNSLSELVAILLDNAIKYSPAKGRVQLRLKRQRHHVVLSVQDQGNGIKQADIPHLFERFYRADSARTKEGVDGHGLGLAIAKSIVDTHRGAIEVTSKPFKGSTFTVKLPLGRRANDIRL